MGNSQPSLKLTYFNIKGVAEKVRVALWLQGIAFEDERVNFADWKEMKATTKHGMLPQLTIGGDGKKAGTVVTDSEAILRYVATLKSETLYPKDPMQRLLVDEVLGLTGDLNKAFGPALYLNMRPEVYGYPEGSQGTEEGKARVLAIRTKAAQELIPRFAGYFEQYLENDAKFLAGSKITIADLSAYFTFARYQDGDIDHIPTTVLDEFKTLTAWMTRVKEAVQGYYDEKTAKAEAEQKAKAEAEEKAKAEAEEKAKAEAEEKAKEETEPAAVTKVEEPAAEEAKAEEPAAEEAKAEEPAAEEAKAEEPAAEEAKAEEPAVEEAKAEEPAAAEVAPASDEAAPAAE